MADGCVAAIEDTLTGSARHQVDLDGRIVVPGFVDGHLRLAGPEGDLEGRAAVLLERAVRHGTTAVSLAVDLPPDEPLAPIRVLARLRAQYADRVAVQIVGAMPARAVDRPGTRDVLGRLSSSGGDGLLVSIETKADAGLLATVLEQTESAGLGIDVSVDTTLPTTEIGPSELALADALALLTHARTTRRARILHATALASVHRDGAVALLAELAALGVPLVVCPGEALRQGGRADAKDARRGLPRLRELMAAGIRVALGSGTVVSEPPPPGAIDLLQAVWLAGYGAHMGVPAALERLCPTMTAGAETLEVGRPADLVCLDAPTFATAVIAHATKRWVFKRGRLVSATSRITERTAPHLAPSTRLHIRQAVLPGRAGLHDVVAVDGIIREISRTTATAPHGGGAADAETIDADGRLIVPAFVDAHLHLDKVLVMERIGLGDRNLTVSEAVEAMRAVKSAYTRDDLLERGRRALALALRHGTTAVRAQCDVDPLIGLLALEVLVALRREWAPLIDLQIVAFPQDGLLGDPKAVDLVRAALAGGADVVGGGPLDPDHAAHIRQVFRLAREFGAAVDIHADLAIDAPGTSGEWAASLVAKETLAAGLDGRVAIGHFARSGTVTAAALRPLAAELAAAGVAVAALSASELYRQGMADLVNSRRGMARVRELTDAGVNVVFASNNIRDAFVTFGDADMLEQALLGAVGAHLDSETDLAMALDMVTSRPARVMGLHHRERIEVGQQADLVLLDAASPAAAVVGQAEKRCVVRKGHVVVRNRRSGDMKP